MPDPRFFAPPDAYDLASLIAALPVELDLALADPADGGRTISGLAALHMAGPGDLSFLDNPKYVGAFETTAAAACFVAEKYANRAPAGCAVIVAKDPYRAYALAAQRLYPEAFEMGQRHPAAVIDPTAKLDPSVSVAAGAVIGPRVEIGANTRIEANATIGHGCAIGRDCRVGANAVVEYALVGDRVTLHAGALVGLDGFGFAMGAAGHAKVPQLGRVILQDDVDVGAGTAIDRGAGPDTVVGEGCKIDNLVQIGHNVQVGRHCVIAGQTAIAGSVVLEDFVAMGGQVAIAGHLRIGAGARIAGGAQVMRDIAAGQTVAGIPARDIKQTMREIATLTRLARTKGKNE